MSNLRDLQRLFESAPGMLASGMPRADVTRILEDGLRACFPAIPDTDPRLWVSCAECEDTGWRIEQNRPKLYGGTVDVRVAVTCRCAKGRAMEEARERAAERAREDGVGRRRMGGLTQVGRVEAPRGRRAS